MVSLNRNAVGGSLRTALAMHSQSLKVLSSAQEYATVGESLMVLGMALACVEDGDKPAILYTRISDLDTAARDLIPLSVMAWASAGYAHENDISVEEMWTPNGWSLVKAYFE